MHGLADGGAQGAAEIVGPATHGATVDGAALAGEDGFEAVERQAVAVFGDEDVCEQRRRGQAAFKEFGRDRGDLDFSHAVGVRETVLGSRDDQNAHALATPGEPRGLLEAGAGGLARCDELFEEWVGQLQPLLVEIELPDIAPTAFGVAGLGGGSWTARPLAAGRRGLLVVRRAGGAGEPVELGEFGRELQLELRCVHALGLGHEDALLEQLQLDPSHLKGRAEAIALDDQTLDGSPRGLQLQHGCLEAGLERFRCRGSDVHR